MITASRALRLLTPVIEQAFSQVFDLGTSVRYAREDHTHGTPSITAIAAAVITANSYTMAAGAITVSGSNPIIIATIDTSGGASENLTTINGGIANQILICQAANAGRTVVLKDSATLDMAYDFSLDNTTDKIGLICRSSGVWEGLFRESAGD